MAAKETKHPVLPKLKKQRQTAGFDERGIWSARQPIALEQLSEDLDILKIGIDINSIPDMWARPLLFEMALFDPDHLLASRVLGEWRGLLAALALKEVSGIANLTLLSVNLPSPQPAAAPTIALSGAQDFVNTLARLAPTRSVASDTSWRKLHVILSEDGAIGMTSPTTLVATATHYFGRLDQNQIPWFDGKRLLDPTGRTSAEGQRFLSEHARDALAWWLNELKKELANQSVTRGGSFRTQSLEGNRLLTRINEYVRDVNPATRVYAWGAGYGISEGIFTLLDKPVKGIGGDPRYSHVVLSSSRRRESILRQVQSADSNAQIAGLEVQGFRDFPAIVLLDLEIAKQWKMSPTDLVVWGSTSLRNAVPYDGFEDDPPPQKQELLGVDGMRAQLWSPKWLFKRQLHVVRKSEALPGTIGINATASNQQLTYGNEAVTPIPPLDMILIDQLTVDDLAERVSFEQRPDGILVRLKLELSGIRGNPEAVEFTKLYSSEKGEIRVIEDVPSLVIWPNFRASEWGWKAYYTYLDTAEVKETFTAKPYNPGLKSAEEKLLTTGGRVTRRVTRTDAYPEALICVTDDYKDEIGYLLVRQPEELTRASLTYDVGVDFGATGTNVYFKAGHDDPKRFEFQDRYVFITSFGAERRATIYYFALPSKEEIAPFLSIFRTFPNAPSQELRPLLDGIIHFPRGPKDLDNPQITYNLKWSGRKDDSHKVEAFLQQICLQVAAEAAVAGAAGIDWSFSYPTAFSNTRKTAFETIWSNSTAWCEKVTGVTSNSISSRTESVATALYFRDPKGFNARMMTGAVCIDIGGSTSDIAVWQKEKLCWQTSIRLAGREIFLDYLFANPHVLSQLRDGNGTDNLSGAGRSNIGFYVAADVLLREEGEKLFSRLPHFAEHQEMVKLEQFLAVALAGIFYYVGLLIHYLRSRGLYSLEIPKFYVGGNGSRIFRWLSMGKAFSSQAAVNEVFKSVFLHASDLDQKPLTIRISDAPKAEAAFGLICGTDLKGVAGEPQMLAGEAFIRGARDKAWNELIDKKTFQDISAPKTLDRVKDFINSFDQAVRKTHIQPIAPSADQRDELLREVRGCLANAIEDSKRLGQDGIELEPIFILGLKCLLRQITERS